MTPVFLNPSSSSFSRDIVEQDNIQDRDQQQHLKLFLVSPYNNVGEDRSSATPKYYSFGSSRNNINQLQYNHQDLARGFVQSHQFHDEQKAMAEIANDKSSSATRNYDVGSGKDIEESGGEVKNWMSSKMRLIQKMSNSQSELINTTQHGKSVADRVDRTQLAFNFNRSSTNGILRVCSDCNTTTTPLWRSGPRGPKSLCNACGIRQRKARRAMAEAAAAEINDVSTSLPVKTSYSYNVTKEKKSRGNSNIGNYNKGKLKLKLVNRNYKGKSTILPSNKRERIGVANNDDEICFGDFASFGLNDSNYSALFPKDVAEAAILLMELSCRGFVHS